GDSRNNAKTGAKWAGTIARKRRELGVAEDWFKVEKVTMRKPEVLQVADILGVHPDHALGLVIRWFAWCDDQLASCHAPRVTLTTIDAVFGHAGFASALVDVGWLRVREGSLEVPNFDRHMSKSAKNRALSGIRKRKQRDETVTQMSRSQRDKIVTREREIEKEKELERQIANSLDGEKQEAEPRNGQVFQLDADEIDTAVARAIQIRRKVPCRNKSEALALCRIAALEIRTLATTYVEDAAEQTRR